MNSFTNHTPPPKHRSSIRKFLGKRYFIVRRYFKWHFGSQPFAKTKTSISLAHKVFEHQSLLLRKLKDVDMHLQYNKITNLKLATKNINHIIIQPGEVFSFWYHVGRTSKRKGYKMGMMLDNGKVVSGIGGGICQLGNLIHWMILHTPLTITERWRHSYDVFPDQNRKIPFGSGATLSYNYVDLQFKNETKQQFQITFRFSETHLHGAIYTNSELNCFYKVKEINHQMRGETWGGYTRHNQIIQQCFDKKNDELITEKIVVENHALMMYIPFLK